MVAVWRVVVGHPKKLVVGTLCSVYCYKFAKEKYRDYVLHREICSNVCSENYKTVNSTQHLRSLTVFVNPFSRHGKVLKEFENNASPILNLSGLDVKMVYLDTDSEIKDFVSVLDPSNTDGIIVAGDDNMIQKAVTSLLCRDDFKTTSLWSLPVGAVPVGIWNGFVNSVHEKTVTPMWFYNVLQSVIQQNTERRNILKVRVVSEDDKLIEQQKTSSATAYSLLGIEWSIWRDIELGGGYGASAKRKKPRNPNDHRGVLTTLSISTPSSWSRNFGALWRSSWYWLRSSENHTQIYPHNTLKASSDFSSDPSFPVLKKNSAKRVKLARLSYAPVCTGCSKCWEKKLMSYKESRYLVTKKPTSLLLRIFGFSLGNRNNMSTTYETKTGRFYEMQKQLKAKSLTDNPECEVEKELIVYDTSGLMITPEGDNIRVDIFRRSTSYLDHIHQFRSWLLSQPYSFKSESQVILCEKLHLFPIETEVSFLYFFLIFPVVKMLLI
ncbi:Acylglycerol kinase isoform 2 [Schistosoma japonicum]|uniref:Acylglycerol kinase isoform 2 n=1 Tax=Schistosoma japonicum TaxID=6182 RepID=A0A4Z2CZ50_SCHJA|nr:Acylglycerol kinase isoform 2 [Schistosoma japonicum]